jgi:hypothetical protein
MQSTHAVRRGRRDLAALQRRLPKSYRPLLRACLSQGGRWAPAAKNKTIIYPPDGSRPVILHATPSDCCARLNDRAQLRRAGFRLT